MPFFDTHWYTNYGNGTSTGHWAVAKRPQNTAVVAGQIVRQFTAPAANSERCFVCIVAGTTANTTDATWSTGRGAKTVDGTATWMEITGTSAMNGDLTNTPTYALSISQNTLSLGQICKRNSGASYQICTTAGSSLVGVDASFSDVAGVTTPDGAAAVWTSLGPVGNFVGGGAPHARLAGAYAGGWYASGNTLFFASNHVETISGGVTIGGTQYSPFAKMLCHNVAGNYPPSSGDLTTGASITVTGGTFSFSHAGSLYMYGMRLVGAGLSIGSAQPGLNWQHLHNCSLQASSGNIALATATSGSYNGFIFENTTVKFGTDSTQGITLSNTHFTWKGGGLEAGSFNPTSLIKQQTSAYSGVAILEGLDLVQLTSGNVFASTINAPGLFSMRDCKLAGALPIATPVTFGVDVEFSRCDSGAATNKTGSYAYEGTETTETAIVRTDGGVDLDSVAQSRKIVTTANAQWLRPFDSTPLMIWNEAVGSPINVSVYGTMNAGSLPTLPLDDEVWLECTALATAGSTKTSLVTTTKSNVLAANASVPSDSSTWANASNVAAAPVTLDAATVTAVTLSGGNLVATNTGTTEFEQGAKGASATGKSTGKYYFEVQRTTSLGSGDDVGAGVSTFATSYTNVGRFGSNGVYMKTSGAVHNGSLQLVSAGVWANGEVYGFAIDLDNRKFWRRLAPSGNWNNAAIGSQNPATNTGGVTIPAGVMVPFMCFGGAGGVAGEVMAANFGASAFVGAVPSGFTSGWLSDPVYWTPFKFTASITPQLPGYIQATVRAAKASATYYIDPKIELS